ncbi:hypothetical protein U0070_014015 [Myodes glareolus]|uniref:Rho-GAP domain-containing protein n=1 Tax=Myodes glareolus TaxID=447135 RepID=A0AAW0HGZ5_MYOGA
MEVGVRKSSYERNVLLYLIRMNVVTSKFLCENQEVMTLFRNTLSDKSQESLEDTRNRIKVRVPGMRRGQAEDDYDKIAILSFPACDLGRKVNDQHGDFTWNSMSGRSVRLRPVPIQSLSELERARLQEVAFYQLQQDCDLGCQITIPKGVICGMICREYNFLVSDKDTLPYSITSEFSREKEELRWTKEKEIIEKETGFPREGEEQRQSPLAEQAPLKNPQMNLELSTSKQIASFDGIREFIPQAFGMPLSQVIANDRAYKLKQDLQREEQKDASDFVSSLLPFGNKRQNKELSSSNSSLSSTSETPNESTSPNTPEPAPRVRRRGAMSVDSITDLDDNQSRLLEALQLSLPAEAQNKKEKARDKKLSLNPIYRQVPRLVDSCCQHLEKHGLQTVGIFRVGSSKKRVRQLREEFDRGIDVCLEEEHSVHDVAALLKEFLRDMPDPLLTRELYTAFINTLLLEPEEQLGTLQLLIYLLPPCNCDTLHRLLQFLSIVASHAEDVSKDGQEVTGNKMTSLNLATIFGPNLLHKQKSSDKEYSVQSSARAEESTAIIAVVQKMIENYETLFMVPPDLQNEVLISLLETDPDVVDYLLRRKASQSSIVTVSLDIYETVDGHKLWPMRTRYQRVYKQCALSTGDF